jgi:hypothetical protein
MNLSPFSCPIFLRHPKKREAAAPKASACFMGGTCAIRVEPGKQNARSCRAQELTRTSAQEKQWQKKAVLLNWEGRCGIGRAM